MEFDPTPEGVYRFLQDPSHPHGVLGYLDEFELPDSAFVAFSITPALEIVFGTSTTSRKASALFRNVPRAPVSFNVSDARPDVRQTIQYRGYAAELSGSELATREDDHYAKLGEGSRRFRDQPDQVFFLIRPTLVRFTSCLHDPWTVVEFANLF